MPLTQFKKENMYFIDIINNPNETTENEFCFINLKTNEIIWKPGKYNPKLPIILSIG